MVVKKKITSTRAPKVVPTKEQHEQPAQTGAISLASAEKDPKVLSLIEEGYTIMDKNEYGALVRQDKGKSTFFPLTENGYEKPDTRSTIVLPKSVDIKMKIKIAKKGITLVQYLTQLVLEDLRKEE